MKTRREFLGMVGVVPAIGMLDRGVLGSALGGQAVKETDSLHAGQPFEQEASRLVDALRDSDPRLVRETTEGEMLIPLWLLKHQSHRVRREAARHFRRFPTGREKVRLRLVGMLKDPARSVRWAAAEALSWVDPNHPGIVSVVVEHVARGGASKSAEFADRDRILEKAFPALRWAITKGHPRVLSELARLMRNSKSPLALRTLLRLARNHHPVVRACAVSSLRCFG